jgi:hypothetical protein
MSHKENFRLQLLMRLFAAQKQSGDALQHRPIGKWPG